MGKAKKLKLSRRGPKVSLDKQIEDDHFAKPSSRVKVRVRKDEDEEVFVTLLLCSVKADFINLKESFVSFGAYCRSPHFWFVVLYILNEV